MYDKSDYKPVDYFEYFFPDNVFGIMTTHTNSNMQLSFLKIGTFYNKWPNTSLNEMQAYVALQIAMSINKKP